MELLQDKAISCPHCGATFSVTLDCSAGSQQFVQDCEYCCQPILFLLEVGWEGSVESLEVRREND